MSATATDVRNFAAANGFTVGARGRFSDELVTAFNAGKVGFARYTPGKVAPKTVKIKARNAAGKLVERKVNVVQARADLLAQGVNVGSRGVIPNNLLAQAVGLTVDAPKVSAVKVARAKLETAGVIPAGQRGRISEANLALAASL